MICCTFAGHREILLDGVEKKLGDALDKLMVQDNGFCFYTGGMGEFDRMCENTVRKYQRQLPEKKIMLVLVEPYMKKVSIRTGSVCRCSTMILSFLQNGQIVIIRKRLHTETNG